MIRLLFSFGVNNASLNPCCNGIYLMILTQKRKYNTVGLNPCCNGIYLMILTTKSL